MKNKNCNLSTCRHNAYGKCTNEEERKECVEVSRKVLCEDENDLIVDYLKITVNPEMMTSLKELLQYKPTKHEDDIRMFNHIYFTSLWRRMENGKDVCLEVRQVK